MDAGARDWREDGEPATEFLTGRNCAAAGLTTDAETAPAIRAEAQVTVAALGDRAVARQVTLPGP
jgi:hypothetical protein